MIEIKECVYFNSVLGVCDIDGSVNCPCENYEELVRMSEITKEKGDMMTAKRYTIKPQNDLFGVVDNYSADKVCVINGIRTEIEAKWLCKDMNALNDENEQLKHNNKMLSMKMSEVSTKYRLLKEFSDDTNPNEAVKTVLHELMMITKEYR